MCLWHHPSHHHHHHPPSSLHSLGNLGDNIDSQRNSVTIYLGLKRRYLLLKQDQMSQEEQLSLALDVSSSLFEITLSPPSTHLAYGVITRRGLPLIQIRA